MDQQQLRWAMVVDTLEVNRLDGSGGGYAGVVSTVERPELGDGIPKISEESEFVKQSYNSSSRNNS